jgi:hypothetical protein
MTTWTGQPEQVSVAVGLTGQPGQVSLDRTARSGWPHRKERTGLPKHDIKEGQPGEDKRNGKTAMTAQSV